MMSDVSCLSCVGGESFQRLPYAVGCWWPHNMSLLWVHIGGAAARRRDFLDLTPSPRLFSGPDGLARERDAPIERTAQRDRVR